MSQLSSPPKTTPSPNESGSTAAQSSPDFLAAYDVRALSEHPFPNAVPGIFIPAILKFRRALLKFCDLLIPAEA